MRSIIGIALILISTSSTFAQKGINFLNTSNLNTAINAAKKQNKLLFVEVYAPDCHVCNSFKGTFSQPQVGNIYNASFISFQLDIRQPENQKILQKLKIVINATPTFLFFDPKTMKLVQAKAFGEKENSVINVNGIAQKAANPTEQASNFANKFKAGERSVAFLNNYAQFARITADTATNIKMVNELIRVLPTTQYINQSALNMMQLTMMNNNNTLFEYFVGHQAQYNRIAEPSLVKMIYENVFQIVLTSSQVNKLTSNEIVKLKSQMAKAGIDKGSIVRRIWMAESNMLFKQKKAMAAIKVIENLINELPSAPGPKEYQYLCDFVKSKTKDKAALKFANENWCKFGMR
ncbi:thioredoxin family protein [Aquirufa sp.]|jgi:thioredoxin-related protein|uniref:thioredoxin family protein n=1 Tax=Aquirufa sp. TaxID=2676249 RepID=UPI0037C13E21